MNPLEREGWQPIGSHDPTTSPYSLGAYHTPAGRVDVYAVGWLAKLRSAWRAYGPHVPDGIKADARRHARQCLKQEWRYSVRQVRQGKWRDVKNTFNGYLAEPYNWPQDGSLRRCGSGWTPARAVRSLRRHGWRG